MFVLQSLIWWGKSNNIHLLFDICKEPTSVSLLFQIIIYKYLILTGHLKAKMIDYFLNLTIHPNYHLFI